MGERRRRKTLRDGESVETKDCFVGHVRHAAAQNVPYVFLADVVMAREGESEVKRVHIHGNTVPTLEG